MAHLAKYSSTVVVLMDEFPSIKLRSSPRQLTRCFEESFFSLRVARL